MSGTSNRLNVELTASGAAAVEAEFGRLEAKLGTLGGAQRKYEQDVALVQRTMERNPALIGRGNQALEALHANFQKGSTSAGGFASALDGMQGGLATVAGRLGPAGAALTALGPGGLAAAAGVAALGAALVPIARAGDDMVASLGRIRAATGSIESAAAVYDQLYRISVQTGQSVSDSASQFQRFSIATKEVGATNAQAVKLVETLQKAAIVGGASSQEASSAALQLGQALASGVLQGEELRSLLENMPNLAVALAQQLGVGVGELRKMGSEGKLTAETILPALLRAGEAINGEYEKMPTTMSRAFDQLNISSSNFLARMDQALGLSQRIAAQLGAAAKALDGLTSRSFASPAQAEQNRYSDLSSRAEDLRGRIRASEAEGPSLTARTGGYQRRAQIVGNMNAGGDLVADMRDELAAIEKDMAASQANRLAILRDGREDQAAEEADAANRRLENQRAANTKAVETLRTGLDKDLATRQAWQKKVDEINGLVGKPGGISAAEGERLIALATKDRDEALKKLQGTQKKVRDEDAEEISAIIREQGKALEQYEDQQNRIFDNAQKTIEGNEEQIRLLQTEAGLLGGNADVRERELAIMRERKRITGEQIKDEQQIATLLEQAGRLWDQNHALEQQRNSFTELERLGTQAFDRIGSAITQAFANGSLKAVDFGNIAKAIFSEVIQSAARMAIINPILNSAFGGTRGTFSGLGGGNGQVIAGGAGQPSLMDIGGGLYKLTGSSGTGGSLMSSAGTWVNDTAASWAPSLFSGSSQATTTALGNMGAATYGPATPAAVQAASTGTFTQYAGGALGLAGGAYGLYSAAQTGGAKGWAQGIGGAASIAGGAATLAGAAGIGGAALTSGAAVAATTTAASVAGLGGAAAGTGAAAAGLGAAGGAIAAIGAVAPYIAVAALIASYFLTGQKPSDRTGTALFNLDSGEVREGGLEGVRRSDENRQAAMDMGRSLSDVAGTLRAAMGVDRTPVAYEIAYGNRDGIHATFLDQSRTYDRSEEGAQQLTKDITQAFVQSMRSMASGEVQAVVDHSGGDTAKLLENLDWYRSVYEPLKSAMDAGATATNAFAAQQEELRKGYDEMTTKARDLGLATSVVTAEYERQRNAALDARNEQVLTIEQTLRERTRTATGLPGSVSVVMQEFEAAADSQRKALKAQLETLGTPVEWINNVLALFGTTIDAEREANLKAATANDIIASRAGQNQVVGNWQRLTGLASRYEAATSSDGRASLEATTAAFDAAAARERSETFEALVQQGLNGTELMFRTMADLERASAAERIKLIQDYSAQARAAEEQAQASSLQAQLSALQELQSQAGVLSSFLDQQAVSGVGVSPQNSFLAAQQQYAQALEEARNGGDLSAYTGAANTLLSASNAYLGTGAEAANIRQQVLSATSSLGASLNLPGFSANLEAGMTRVVDRLGEKVLPLGEQVSRLADELRAQRLRAA
jgi:tape measure domain-containing protein